MTKIYNSDLVSANSSSLLQALDSMKEDCDNIGNYINSFIEGSASNLIGGGYDAVRCKLSLYVDGYKKQGIICDNLKSNIIAANNTMINYMEGYSYLDTSELPQIKDSINEIRNMIASLCAQAEKVKDPFYINLMINQLNGQLSTLIHLKDLLENLESADAGAFGMISDVSIDIDSYLNAVDGIDDTTFNKNKDSQGEDADQSEDEVYDSPASVPNNAKDREKYLYPDGFPLGNSSAISESLTYITVEGYDADGNLTSQELRVHKKLAESVKQAYEDMKNIGYPALASKSWGYVEKYTGGGPGGASAHALGAGIDVNAVYNRQYLDPANNTSEYAITQEVVDIWAKQGFSWGGDWEGQYDGMHFTYTGY